MISSLQLSRALFHNDNADRQSYPHAHSYQSHAWDEYNLGSLENLDIQFYRSIDDPSHIHLCRALVSKDEIPQSKSPKQTIVVVDEEDLVCQDQRNPYKALLTMFASSLVAHVAHVLGKTHIFYEHSCGTQMAQIHPDPKSWMDLATIQQLLPPFLKMGFSNVEEQIIVPMVTDACNQCLQEFELVQSSQGNQEALLQKRFPRCLLFPSSVANTDPIRNLRRRNLQTSSNIGPWRTDPTLEHDDHVHLEIIKGLLPTLKNNLRQAAEEWRNLRHLNIQAQAWIGADVTSLRGKKGFTEQRSQGTIVYIECAHGDCEKPDAVSLALPLHVYASQIPRSAHAVEIIVSHSCATLIGGCGTHALWLKEFLASYLPESNVTLEQFQGNTGSLYARMMLAGHLLAPPSLSSVVAVLAKSHSSTLFHSPELYPWMDQLMQLQQAHQLSYGQSLGGIHYFAQQVPVIKSPFHDMALLEFLNTPMDKTLRSDECRDVRGRFGHWTRADLDFVRAAQYQTPIAGYAGNADLAWKPMMDATLENGPYRNATQYRWVDHFEASCPVNLLNRQGLCNTLVVLGIKRVMFVGDSLMFHWSQAFWKILGNTDTPGSDTTLTWSQMLSCGETNDEIKFIFVRNDKLDNVTGPVEYGVSNCGGFGYCHPWRSRYAGQSEPTLLIANTGAHHYDSDEYMADVDSFLEFVHQLNRTSDLVFMRNTVPGHPKCKNLVEPFKDYDEFAEHADYSERPYSIFNWNMFPAYNRYLDESIQAYKDKSHYGLGEKSYENLTKTAKVSIELLDVYPMTILRPDGHIAGVDNLVEQYLASDKCHNCPPHKATWAEDCLHYSLPGPIDWWSHLLYSTLQDVASSRQI